MTIKSGKNKSNDLKIENGWPATLYVEGQDQFRGWFNSSLITSVILTHKAPYKQVLSHGFVVDEKGHKMSKSLGNVIDIDDIIEKFGVDVLRLWVISSDFTKEVRVSIPILENLRESYWKIRNTLRFLLGNLANLPTEVKTEEDLEKNLNLVDYYILHQLEKLVKESEKKYSEYNFNPIYFSLLNFCINDLSSFYFEIIKDSLYCDGLNSLRRKQIIAVLYYLLGGLLKVISPILPFLTEEVYQSVPFRFGFVGQESIHLVNNFPIFLFSSDIEKELTLITNFFLPLRQGVYQACEKARQEKIINTNSQVCLTIYLKEKNNLDYSQLDLTNLLLVSKVKFITKLEVDMWEGSFFFLKIEKTASERCIRCWNYRELEEDFCLRCKRFFLFK